MILAVCFSSISTMPVYLPMTIKNIEATEKDFEKSLKNITDQNIR